MISVGKKTATSLLTKPISTRLMNISCDSIDLFLKYESIAFH